MGVHVYGDSGVVIGGLSWLLILVRSVVWKEVCFWCGLCGA